MFLSDDDVYSITHVLFYLSDFAARRIIFLDGRTVDSIHDILCHLIGVYIRARNWDLTAELLAAEACLGKGSRYSAAGWSTLATVQQRDGRMDGPYLTKLAEDARGSEQMFDACYHTTLVSALAGAVCTAAVAGSPRRHVGAH
jgi:hypothetical protein